MHILITSYLFLCRRHTSAIREVRKTAQATANCYSCFKSPRTVRLFESHLNIRQLITSDDYRIPYLYEQAYQWYESFDLLGEILDRPNPTPALELLSSVFKHLTDDCQWPPDRVHLFGFAQGGSVATEFALKWWRSELEKQRQAQIKPTEGHAIEQANTAYLPKALGSIVTIAGPLLSYPTIKTLCPTPLIALHRPSPSQTSLSAGSLTALKKGVQQRLGSDFAKG